MRDHLSWETDCHFQNWCLGTEKPKGIHWFHKTGHEKVVKHGGSEPTERISVNLGNVPWVSYDTEGATHQDNELSRNQMCLTRTEVYILEHLV